jgi:hypothetical protein
MEALRVNFLFYDELGGQRYCQIVLGEAAVASEAILSVYAAEGTMVNACCCDIHDLPRKSAWWESSVLLPYRDEVLGSAEDDEVLDEYLSEDAAGGALFEIIP